MRLKNGAGQTTMIRAKRAPSPTLNVLGLPNEFRGLAHPAP